MKILRLITLSLLMTFSMSLYSAKPDLERISTLTHDSSSQFYWPKLLKKYAANDTTMTDEEYTYLYYGFMFQDHYEPYHHQHFPEQKEIEYLYRKDKRQSFESKRIAEYAQKVLQSNPFDLIQLNYMVVALNEMGKVNLSNIWRNKLAHLLKVIGSSGTGLDQENAWYVIFPKHEYDFLNLNGISAQSQEFQEPHYDFIKTIPKEGSQTKGYYFNLLPILEQYYKKHPEELDPDPCNEY